MRLTRLFCILLMSILMLLPMRAGSLPREHLHYELTASEMQNEIEKMWSIWLMDQERWTQEKLAKHVPSWPKLANAVAQSVKKFQHEPVELWEGSGRVALLPLGKDAHLIAGSMAISETKVNPELVGKAGEIGILQCHPKWCLVDDPELRKLPRGKRMKRAQKEPELNIELAVKHFTRSYKFCGIDIREDEDWIEPVSYYSSGRLDKKKGQCVRLLTGVRKVKRMQRYRARLRNSHRLSVFFGRK